MEESSTIRSAANAACKRVKAVTAGRVEGRILLEGERLIDDARRGGLEIEQVLVSEERPELLERWSRAGLPVRPVLASIAERLGTVKGSPGCVAVAVKPRTWDLEALLDRNRGCLLLVVAGMADPGNLGAVARSAEAAGVTALVVVAGGVSPWNPRVLRGSMGSLLRFDLAEAADAEELAETLAERGFRQVRAATAGGAAPREMDWRGPVALWVSAETGRMPEAAADFEAVTIPMAGRAESLNAAVAAAVILFQAAEARAVPRVPWEVRP